MTDKHLCVKINTREEDSAVGTALRLALESGKYEVCDLTAGEMTKADMMCGCYYC